MKKLKLILPMMAFIFAIGLSFAFVAFNANPNNDFIHLGGNSWQSIPEIECTQGSETCTVQLSEGGPIYEVYDDKDLSTQKDSDTDEPVRLYE